MIKNLKIIILNKIFFILFISIISVLCCCSCNNVSHNTNNYELLDSLYFNTNIIPFIIKNDVAFNVLGSPDTFKNIKFITNINSEKYTYDTKIIIWDNFSYIKIDSFYLLNTILFKDRNTSITINNNIVLNRKTRLSFIKRKFPNSYKNKIPVSHSFSFYYPNKITDDLLLLQFKTEYCYINMYFLKGKLFYIETNLNELFKHIKH